MPYTFRNSILPIILIIFLLIAKVKAQPTIIPELKRKALQLELKKNFEQDTSYINTLHQLARGYYSLNVDSMRFFANKALLLARKSGYQKGEAESLKQLASSYRLTNDIVPMLNYYQEALAIAEEIKDSLLIAKIITNIGFYYSSMERYDEALANIKRAYFLTLPTKNKAEIADIMSDVGDMYFFRKNYDSALYFNRKAMKIATEINDRYIIAFVSSGIGKIFYALNNYSEALKYFIPPHDYYVETNDRLGQIHTSILMGKCYQKLKENELAIHFAKTALDSAKSENLKREIMDAANILACAYENKSDIKNAFSYYKLFKTYADSVFNEETRKKTYEIEARYAYERKEEMFKADQEKKDLITNHQLRIQKEKISLAIFSTIILCIVAIFLFISRANKHKLNLLLNEKNKKISKQKEEIEEQAKALAINNNFKDKLFSIVSHDLRSPLNSLSSVLTLLQLKKLPPEDIEKLISRLRIDVSNTTELVNTLLSWAHNQMKGFSLSPENIDFNETVDKIISLFNTQTKEKQLTLTSLVPPHTFVFADTNMVQIIVRNLISNAIKFCKLGDSIAIQCKTTGDFLEICVFDTGIGIKEEVLKKILNNESVTTFGTQSEKGSGLGLLLCKEFIEKNGGKFWIESNVGEGSYFYFTLPNYKV